MQRVLFMMILWATGNPFVSYAQEQMSPGEIQQALVKLQKSRADTNQVNLLLHLGKSYILKPGENAPDMDSALLFIGKAGAVSRRIGYQKGLNACCLQYSMLYREKGEKEKARVFVDSAIVLSNRYNENHLLGESYIELSQFYSAREPGEFPRKLDAYRQAHAAFKRGNHIERMAFCLKNIGDLYQFDNKIPEAIGEIRQALTLYKSVGYTKLQGVYDLLGVLYATLTDYTSAVKYGLLAIQTAEKERDTSLQLCTIYNRMGMIHNSIKDYTAAKDFFRKAFAIAERYQDEPSIFFIATSIVNTNLKTNKTAESLEFLNGIVKKYSGEKKDGGYKDKENRSDNMYLSIYTIAKDFKQARKYCDKILSAGFVLNETRDPYTVRNLFYYYLTSKQYDKAEECLEVSDKLMKELNINYERGNNYLLWFRLDSSRNNYLSAIRHYQQYRSFGDSLLTENKRKQLATLQIEYETAKKDDDINLKAQSIALLTKQTELQNQQLLRSRWIRNGILAGSVILIVILGLLYNQYRTKKIANKKIFEKNNTLQHLIDEKEWLLKEIHHRVKNNLQTVVSLLESQSAYLRDDALLAIQDSQNRVYAMSLIHQKLYQAENVAAIDMGIYLPELVGYLRDSFNVPHQIRFQLDITPAELDVSQAVPVGLIVNEAITNSIKYAFREGDNSKIITVSMTKAPDNRILLEITDNGAGVPPDVEKQGSGGLGLKLMKGLTEDIEGQFSIQGEQGTKITVSFIANIPLRKAGEATLIQPVSKIA